MGCVWGAACGGQEGFKMYARYLNNYAEYAQGIGLRLNWSKGYLLLPPGVPKPDANSGLSAALRITTEGVMVGGALT
jgi:hypothetical protein